MTHILIVTSSMEISLIDILHIEDLQPILLKLLTKSEINLQIVVLNLVCSQFHSIIQTMIKTKFQHLTKPKKYQLCIQAALSGNIDLLKLTCWIGFSWNESTCSSASENGYLEVLKWARENGCPWDELTCSKAAENGYLEVLKWAHDNGCPWDEWMILLYDRYRSYNKTFRLEYRYAIFPIRELVHMPLKMGISKF